MGTAHQSSAPLRVLRGEKNRRGVLLLIVLGLLAMFALIGVTFVLLASHERRAAEIHARAAQDTQNPRALVNETILQVVRGTNQSNSVLRPHSLLEDMYGRDEMPRGTIVGGSIDTSSPGNATAVLNVINLTRDDVDRFVGLCVRMHVASLQHRPAQIISFTPGSPAQITIDADVFPVGEQTALGTLLSNNTPVSFEICGAVHDTAHGVLQAGEQLIALPATNSMNQHDVANPHQFIGRLIYMIDGPAAGQMSRIVDYRPASPPGYSTTREFIVLGFKGVTTAQLVDYWNGDDNMPYTIDDRPIAYAIYCATPFSGTGFGYNPGAAIGTPTEPQLTATFTDPLSGQTLPFALAPNLVNLPSGYVNAATLGGANEDYDAADYQNMLLAMQLAEDTMIGPDTYPAGTTPIPSLHRPELINYWFHQLPSILGPSATFTTTSDLNRKTWFTDPTVRIGGTNLPIDEQRVITALKRRILLRPSQEDHIRPFQTDAEKDYHGFTGGNMTFGGNTHTINASLYPLWDGFSNPVPFDLNLNGTLDAGDYIRCDWDVDNDGDGVADSIWVDVGLPVRTDENGRHYKPLVAILCVDLDSRLNLNAHGCLAQTVGGYYNPQPVGASIVAGPTNSLSSPRGQGAGPAEVNLAAALPALSAQHPQTGSGISGDPERLPRSQYDVLMRGIAPKAKSNVAGRYGPVDLTNPSNPVWAMPGRVGLGEPLTQNKFFDCPTAYDPASTATTFSYGTPMDLAGGLVVGLDLRGQPLYAALVASPPGPTNGYGIAATDNPYELNLFGEARGAADSGSPDAPFSPAELEAVLRPYDVDAAQLPNRLAALAPTLLQDRRAGRLLTTDSWDLPVPAVALPPELRATGVLAGSDNRALQVIDLLRAKLRAENPSMTDAQVSAALPYLLSAEMIAGLRMDLNRPLGNGRDDNTNGVVDEPGQIIVDTNDVDGDGNTTELIIDPNQPGEVVELLSQMNRADAAIDSISFSHAGDTDVNNDGVVDDFDNALARQLHARQLYVMMLLLMNYDPSGANHETDARQAAQWAVNIVDFRDRDAIMTPFEYDMNPFTDANGDGNPWDVNSLLGGADGAAPAPDDAAGYRGLVWGCERPELLLSETLATHDRRTDDTASEVAEAGEQAATTTDPDPLRRDGDFDQRRRPQGSLFIELYNPSTANEPLPGEFYSDLGPTGGVALDRRTPGAAGSPVWRLIVVKQQLDGDPDAPDAAARPPIERAAYFVDSAMGLPANVFIPVQCYRDGANNPIAPIRPGRYAVIGPNDESHDGVATTFLGVCPTSSADLDRMRRIVLRPSSDPDQASQVEIYADGQNNALNGLSIQRPTAITLGGSQRLSISEPPQGYPADDPTGTAGTGTYNPDTDVFTYAMAYDVPRDRELWEDWASNHAGSDDFWNTCLSGNGTHPRVAVVHLQRLANPLQPYDAEANPYRTIDSMPVDLTVYNSAQDESATPDPGRAAGDADDEPDFFNSRERGESEEGEVAPPRATDVTNNLWAQFLPATAALPPHSPYPVTLTTGAAPHVYSEAFACTLGYLNEGFHRFDPSEATPPFKWYTASEVPAAYVGSPRQPFPWLTWLNRPLASPGDLMLVPKWSSYDLLSPLRFSLAPTSPSSATSPYTETGQPFGHLTNYFFDDGAAVAQPNWKLHRLLEFVRVPSRFTGTDLQGNPTAFTPDANHQHSFQPPFNRLSEYREPGKININTIASLNVWRGFMNFLPNCDAAWNLFVDSRRSYDGTSGDQWTMDTTGYLPTRFANPFRSFAGKYLVPNSTLQDAIGDSEIDATLLREGATSGQPLFSFASTAAANDTNRNPAFRYGLFNRLENTVTTRSNVYAVWVTVGYFEATPIAFDDPDGDGYDPQGRTQSQFAQIYPDGYQLGAELGADSGETRRHRGFSIIDRSIPVGFQRGSDLNVENTILLRRFIE